MSIDHRQPLHGLTTNDKMLNVIMKTKNQYICPQIAVLSYISPSLMAGSQTTTGNVDPISEDGMDGD